MIGLSALADSIPREFLARPTRRKESRREKGKKRKVKIKGKENRSFLLSFFLSPRGVCSQETSLTRVEDGAFLELKRP